MECVFVSILLKSQSSYWVSWKKRRGANTQACPPGLWQQRDLLYGLMDCLSSYSPGTSGCEAVTAVCVLPLFGLSIGGNRTKMSARRIHLICLTSDETKWSSTARCNQKMQLSLKLIVAMVIPSIHPVKLSPCSEMSTVSYSKYQSIIELIILSKHIKLLVQIRLHCHSVLCNGNSLVTQTLLTHWLCYCVTFIFIFCVCVCLSVLFTPFLLFLSSSRCGERHS